MKNYSLKNTLLIIAILFTSSLFAQDWVNMMQDPNVNFYDVQKAFNKYYLKAERQIEKEKRRLRKAGGENLSEEEIEVPGTTQYKRWESFMEPRISKTGERFSPDAVWQEMKKYHDQYGTFAAGSWSLIGPTATSALAGAGRINFVRVHPTNPSTIYIGSPGGGLWVSTNGGTSWSTNTDWMAQVIGCSDLAFDPTNPNTMYLATGDGDGGDTYTVGLLKSTDGGITWNTTGLSFGMGAYRQMSRVLVDPTNGNNIYVATSTGIFKSTNAGVTFTNVLQGSFKSMEFKPGTPTTIYCAGTTFYYSTNSGSTWTAATGITAAASLSRLALAVSPATPATVYVISGLAQPNYGVDGFYASTNSGASFTKKSTPAWTASTGFGSQEWYDLAIAANPVTANEVIIGGQLVVYKSTNGGTSWSTIAGTTHVDYHCLSYASSTTSTDLYLTSDGGVYHSTNDGSSWSNINNNLTIAELYGFGQSTTNASLLLTGWQDNGTNRYNGTWSSSMGGDGMLAFVGWSNDQNMWGSQYNGTLNKSTNGGSSFTTMTGIAETCPWVTEWNEDPVTGGTVYAGCANVWKASGTAFTKLSGNLAGTSTVAITSIAVSPANNQIIWAAKGGTLYKTTNGGTSWSPISGLPSGTITDIVCHKTNVNKVWVCFSGFTNALKVYQTKNGGTSWINNSASLPNIPMNCMAIDNNSADGIYLGTDDGVFYKDSTMTVWQPFTGSGTNKIPNVRVTQLNIFYAGSPVKLRASTYGRGVWETTLYQAGAYAPTANFGANKQIGCPGLGVQFSDWSAGQPTAWSWTFQGGNPATSTQQNPFVAYNSPGTYSVSLTATNANGTDSKTYTGFITISNSTNAAPTATGKNYCGTPPQAVSLSATPAAAGTVRWWNQVAGGSVVGTGNNYTTPAISGTQTYYVDEAFPSGGIDIVGETSNSIGAGGMFTASDIRGLYFDVLQPVVINSVQVYCNSAGIRTIEIYDSNGNWVTDTTLNIPANATTLQTVTINRTVYPGTNYFIKFRGTVDCYRNSAGAAYPYTSSAINITNSNAGSPGYYYFFYNWTYTSIVCNTGRTAVTVTDTCSTIGVNDLFANNYIDVYPNPSNGLFNVAFQTSQLDNYTVKVTNTIGQTVYEEKLTSFSGNYSNKIDISTFRKGIYLLSVSNSKNQTVKKVIVY